MKLWQKISGGFIGSLATAILAAWAWVSMVNKGVNTPCPIEAIKPPWVSMMALPETATGLVEAAQCSSGWAVVRVSNIPVMTDSNKDELNKQVLFCLTDQDGTNLIAVYHRYLQPRWPVGPWWPTWKLEAGALGCIGDWSVWQSMPLPAPGAVFGIVWYPHQVLCAELNDEATELKSAIQTINLPGVGLAFSRGVHIGNECSLGPDYQPHASVAAAALDGWGCWSGGQPSPCATSVPAPTATPDTETTAFISGSVMVEISGSTAWTAEPADGRKMIMCALVNTQTGAWCALRHRDREGETIGRWQVKGVSANDAPDPCWAEAPNYWACPPCVDGNWTVSWTAADGASSVSVTDPSGHTETCSWSYRMAWTGIEMGNCSGCRGAAPWTGQAHVVSWQPGEHGTAEVCR